MEVKEIQERKVTWEQFQKYFKDKYLLAQNYDNKMKEFHELKLGQKSMEDHVQKFMELLRYVDYIREERVKIKSFLGGLPLSYQDRIELANPWTLEETICMEAHYYEQGKGNMEVQPSWKGKF